MVLICDAGAVAVMVIVVGTPVKGCGFLCAYGAQIA